MDVDSLAFRTDLALLEYGGSEIEDHGTHLSVRTPNNPTFWWGNFLLLPRPPAADEVPAWLATFESTFPGSGHRAFGVDGTTGSVADLTAFAEAGLEVDSSSVMTSRAVHEPARPNTEARVRPLAGDDDWTQQVELSMAGEDTPGGLEFVTKKAAADRALTARGLGQWYGAFLGRRLVASLGLFATGGGLARFQNVKTHPDARGHGLAGTLVHAASRFGFEELDCETLVMVADPDYLAIRIYRSVGFDDTETQLGADRKPPD